MDKPKLELIKKSTILQSEVLMKDFEWIFLDVKQVQNRIRWLMRMLFLDCAPNIKLEKGAVKVIIREAFEEIKITDTSGDLPK